MRVLTMNVQNDTGDPRRTGLINTELRRRAPDLVTLQEVCHPRDHLGELIDGAGLAHTTQQAEILGPNEFGHGSVIATRWPHRVIEVREHRGDPHWWTLAVAVEIPDRGERLFVVPTTPWRLEHEGARETQMRDLVDLASKQAMPTVIAGDFNASPTSPSIRHLTQYYADAWSAAGDDDPGHTWTVDNPVAALEIARLLGDLTHRRRIDYIFTNLPITSTTLVGNHPIDEVWLSDHYGVLADLK
ncbi:endonuclease/exonuclease/phosphatase family protein [Kribbella sancticallisti]|uniref:Endonuclease/exonuclease/phosphatase family protein n=1 Tax=Kribbella sancticallisti TaxID=460087 RepID=A0ABN2EDG9_9ACTN